MRHARPDYNRFQDPAGIIPADEPAFLLRGQDVMAPDALRAYADLVERHSGDPDVVKRPREWAQEMETWQLGHRHKMPDL